MLVGFWADKAFAAKIDRARGVQPRSGFLRDALKEVLRSRGIQVADDEAGAPDRLGKGGPKTYPPYQGQRLELNEASSAPAPPKTEAEVVAALEKLDAKLDQSPAAPVPIVRSGGTSRRKRPPGAT